MGRTKDLFIEQREYELTEEEEDMQRMRGGALHLRKRDVPMVLQTAEQGRNEREQHD